VVTTYIVLSKCKNARSVRLIARAGASKARAQQTSCHADWRNRFIVAEQFFVFALVVVRRRSHWFGALVVSDHLTLNEVLVETVLVEQFLVSTLLLDATLVDDDDFVCLLDGAQSMRD